MKIKCLLVDDEPLALNLLENYVLRTPFLELVAKCGNAIDALKYIENEKIELIFLDIQMPELNGIEFSRIIKDRVKIIFTTAFEQYAIEGFRVNAVDYLLKPVNYADFLAAADKAREQIQKTAEKNQERNDNSIFVKSGYRLIKIDLNDITFIEVLKDYVSIHFENSDIITSLMSLKSLEEKLPSEKFMRVHRSFIVHLDKIKTIEKNRIIFGKNYIPISDSYKEEFQKFITDRFFG